MRNYLITTFCDKFNACVEGREWALSTGCRTMGELWERKDLSFEHRLWIATRPGVFNREALRLFACYCARSVWHLLEDERSRDAIRVAEGHTRGDATDEQLAAARAAAWDAAWDAASAARAAAWDADRDAARAAAWAAARDAASAAWDAASAASAANDDKFNRKLKSYGNPFMEEGRDGAHKAAAGTPC